MTDQPRTVKHDDCDYPVCPHCGWAELYWYETSLAEKDVATLMCGRCERDYAAAKIVSVTFSTEPITTVQATVTKEASE